MSKLHIIPLSLAEASAFVAAHHRHHKPPVGHKFSIGAMFTFADGPEDDHGVLVGAAIVGRPVARHLDDARTLEVTRTATDGTPNANSVLYGAARRVAFAMGYDRLITYTQSGESGASLKAAGWRVLAQRPARAGWWTPSRPRDNRNDQTPRTLWEAA